MMGKKVLLVGLGNVGKEYEGTRHNIGFEALDKIALSMQVVFEVSRYAFIAEKKYRGKNILLIKPTTYMNASGQAVKYWSEKFHVAISDVMVVMDDLDISLGMLRIRMQGSSGGHNGLKSIEQSLGTKSYPRIRIGISRPSQSEDVKDFVLGSWNSQEIVEKDLILDQVKSAFYFMLKHGVKNTMNIYNSKVKNGEVL